MIHTLTKHPAIHPVAMIPHLNTSGSVVAIVPIVHSSVGWVGKEAMGTDDLADPQDISVNQVVEVLPNT
jgi:hypothetical protein